MLNNIVWLVFDSARYDAFVAARTPEIDRIGPTQRRFSYASWTAPSHYAFLMGLPPHANEPGVLSADAHRRDLALWQQRIGDDFGRAVSFADFVPSLSLPAFLKSIGYRTEAYVSLPVLNPSTLIAQHFDRFELMPTHNDLAAIVSRLAFSNEPRFVFINTGETHYPYALPHEDTNDLPRISGVHGVWRDLDDFLRHPGATAPAGSQPVSFDPERLRPLWQKQVACIEYLDRIVGGLIDKAPAKTWFIVTADHGELFGEGGHFGHGPVVHEKVFEVFFVEGPNPRAADAEADTTSERSVTMARLKQLGYV
jgi:sulfatase-like protein